MYIQITNDHKSVIRWNEIGIREQMLNEKFSSYFNG